MLNKRHKGKPGNIVCIEIESQLHAYARILHREHYVFYDFLSSTKVPSAQVVSQQILFFAAVAPDFVRSGRWPIIGHSPLEETFRPPPQFIQDVLDKTKFELYFSDGQIVPATREQCLGLERASVWYPDLIEDRLRDHFAGRRNEILLSQEIDRDIFPV